MEPRHLVGNTLDKLLSASSDWGSPYCVVELHMGSLRDRVQKKAIGFGWQMLVASRVQACLIPFLILPLLVSISARNECCLALRVTSHQCAGSVSGPALLLLIAAECSRLGALHSFPRLFEGKAARYQGMVLSNGQDLPSGTSVSLKGTLRFNCCCLDFPQRPSFSLRFSL